MNELVGSVVAGYRITEPLFSGSWQVFRGLAPDGGRVLVTVTCPPTPERVVVGLGLPVDGIPALRIAAPLAVEGQDGLAVIEDEPHGVAISDLKWPLPIAEVITVGLDLARVLQRLHGAGAIHGALRPQTTWIHTVDGRCSLAGTTPRPELAGLHCLSEATTGAMTPFIADLFCDDTIARGEPRGVASDIGQLGMMLYRMATHASPFVRESGVGDQVARAVRGDIPPWPAGDARTRAVEELARAAFDPARAKQRSLAALLAALEQQN